MHLLLTRPDGRNQTLAKRLVEMGHRVTIAPMVTLAPNPDAGPNPLTEADGAFFVSRTAVEFADRQMQAQWPTLACFAVGQGTASALQQVGLTPFFPAEGHETSEGVLELPQWERLPGRRIVIVRGVGGREKVAEELKKRGFSVNYWELYRRLPPKLQMYCTEGWRRDGVNAILATSCEILENLFSVTPLADQDWLKNQLWLVPVERVAELARRRGCHRVRVIGGAGDDAIVRCLGTMSRYGEDPEGS